MNICLIGDSLTSLALAKNLINKNIKVLASVRLIKLSPIKHTFIIKI